MIHGLTNLYAQGGGILFGWVGESQRVGGEVKKCSTMSIRGPDGLVYRGNKIGGGGGTNLVTLSLKCKYKKIRNNFKIMW